MIFHDVFHVEFRGIHVDFPFSTPPLKGVEWKKIHAWKEDAVRNHSR
jgi:hypothetical protein